LPFGHANWLLAEHDAACLRLATAEVELQELRTKGVVLHSNAAPSDSEELTSRLPEWLTVIEFADATGISKHLAYDLVRRRELKPVRRFGPLIRIHRDALRVPDKHHG
jgi:excisionase family DNA binding protein